MYMYFLAAQRGLCAISILDSNHRSISSHHSIHTMPCAPAHFPSIPPSNLCVYVFVLCVCAVWVYDDIYGDGRPPQTGVWGPGQFPETYP